MAITSFATRTGFATPLPATLIQSVAPTPTPAPALLPSTKISQVATVASITVGLFDTAIVINKPTLSATTILLPQSAKFLGAALFVLDWNGNGGTITFTPSGGDLINNAALWNVTSTPTAPAGVRLIPINTAGLAGWVLF